MKKILPATSLFLILGTFIFADIFHPLQLVKEEGNTIAERIDTPFKFKRIPAKKQSFEYFLRNYPLKPADSQVRLFYGEKKANQDAHCAIFNLPLEKKDIQKDAGSIIKLYAEYMFKYGLDNKISFHFEGGELSPWKEWEKKAEKKRVLKANVAGNLKNWTKYEKPDSPSRAEFFQEYLTEVLSNTSILSMQTYETEPVNFQNVKIGDILWDLGKPGHLCLVVDMCINSENGEKAILLAQGGVPSQDFHVIKNPKRINDPWYHESDLQVAAMTPEYTFPKNSWRKMKILNK